METRLGEVHQLVEKGAYSGAEKQAKAVKEKGGVIVEEIRQAIEMTEERNPPLGGKTRWTTVLLEVQ